MSRRLRLLAVLPFLALGLTACGSSVAAGDVAEKAEDALEEEFGIRPDISCPDDLDAEVGASTRCTLTAGDDEAEYGTTVTVTSIEDDTANFSVEVDEEPLE